MNNFPNQFNNQYTPAPVIQRPPIKPLFERKVSDLIAAAVLILISVFYVSALFWNGLHLGYTLVYNCILIFMSVFVFKKAAKFKFTFLICALLSAACSCSFFITDNNAVKAVSFLLLTFTAILWFSSVAGKEYKKTDLSVFSYPFSVIINSFSNIPALCKAFFAKGKSKSKNTSRILIGVACSIPVLFIVVPLLLKSDEAFSSLLSGFFENFLTIFAKAFLGTYVAAFLIVLAFSLKYDNRQPEALSVGTRVNPVTISAFLCMISSVYLIYLFSQLAYFFSAFSSILPAGYKFTYAEYARRGFFELCIIAVINLAVIYAAILLSRNEDGKIPLAVRLPSAFMVIFTFVIIFTALSKMVMYIGAYGFTVLRVLTSAFMIWMFIFFIGILIRLFVKRLDVLATGLVFALIIISVLGLGNMNGRIAEYNYNGYMSGKFKTDVKYFGSLGAEGVPYLYKLTKSEDEKISKTAKYELYCKYEAYYVLDESNYEAGDPLEDIKSYKEFSELERVYSGVESYSIPLEKAYEILDKYAKEQNGKVYAEYYYDEDEDESGASLEFDDY